MELMLALEQEPDVEEIARGTGLEAAVVVHLGYEVVAVVVITRKMSKMGKENISVDLVEEDLVAAHACQTDPEEKDLAVEAVVLEAGAEEDSVEDNADQLQPQKHGMKMLNIPAPSRTSNRGESIFHPQKTGTTKSTLVL